MKIIISHDIDHVNIWEHFTKDLIMPKHFVRSNIELIKRKITLKEYGRRHLDLFTNQWQRINEIMDYNDSLGFKSSFFMGVNNGLGLNYNISQTKKWVPIIKNRKFDIGIHGIDFENADSIKVEYDQFKAIIAQEDIGIRMHYLRLTDETLDNLSKIGYKYDSTTFEHKNPYLVNKMWEFPVQLMDTWVLNGDTSHQLRNLEECKEYSIKSINEALEKGLDYFTIIFHDVYFSASFNTLNEWYKWIVDYLHENGHIFTTFTAAIEELNSKENN